MVQLVEGSKNSNINMHDVIYDNECKAVFFGAVGFEPMTMTDILLIHGPSSFTITLSNEAAVNVVHRRKNCTNRVGS